MHRSRARASEANWQQALAEACRDPGELLQQLGLDPRLADLPASVCRDFPLRVPQSFIARMRPGDPDDPLLRQVLPLASEARAVPGYVADPLAERSAARGPGLLQKYHGRALLIVTAACAVHCRYCFRRAFPYQQQRASGRQAQAVLAELRADASIEEIILSGGDPLSLSDARLGWWLTELQRLPQLRRLRIHTRLPVVLPSRVTAELLAMIAACRRPLVIVLHVNHAQELDTATITALRRLRSSGATLLNQAVLLAGVNDSVAALCELSERLFAAGVLPYYLHLLDPVAGAAHFELPLARAQALMGEVAARLPGYLVPRLVREIPGAAAKTSVEFAVHKAGPSHNQNRVT